EAEDAAFSPVRSDDIELTFNIKSDALRTSESRVKTLHLTAGRHAIDGIEAGSRRAGHIKVVVEAECQMVCGDARLQRGEDKYFFACADLKDASAAVADVEIPIAIERHACGDAHSFDK